jgi:hypothetical protein
MKNTAFQWFAIVAAVTVAAGAQAEYIENFDDGGDFPWEVIDYGWDAWGWGYNDDCYDEDLGLYRGNFTTGVGGAAHVDVRWYQHITDFDVGMYSPWITIQPGEDLYFTVNYQTYDYWDDEFSVNLITPGGGVYWLETYTEPLGEKPTFPYAHDEPKGVEVMIELDDFEGSTVQLEFRYSGFGYNHWVQVDDVRVIPAPASLALPGLGGALVARRRRFV